MSVSSTSEIDQPIGVMGRLDQFLDQHVLPWPVKYLTNRITILATLLLLIPLIAFATNQVLILLANSYLNVMSVVVSSTVLLYSTISEKRDKAAAQRREEIAATHQRLLDERSEEDHNRIEEINTHIDEIHSEVMQHITTSLDRIEKLMFERINQMQTEANSHIDENHGSVLATMASHKEELAEMRQILDSLRPPTSD
jgi:hypothetical protein